MTLVTLALVKREALIDRLGTWRAASLLEESVEAASTGDWNAAARAALAAWQLNPGDIAILRQLFNTARHQGSLEALEVGRTLFTHSEATTEDRVEIMQVFFKIGDHVTVAELLARLSTQEQKSPAVMTLSARFLIARQRPLEALRVIDQLRKTRNEKSDLLLAADAMSLISSRENRSRDEAQRIIDELFRPEVDGEIALKAFSLLQRIPPAERQLDRFADAGERLNSIAEKLPVPATLWLLADEITIAISPKRREAIIHAAISRWLRPAPNALGEWLLNLGEPTLLLDYFPADSASLSLELLALKVEARAMKKEWAEALALLDTAPHSLDPAIVLGLKGMVRTRMGKIAAANQDWQRALRYAGLAGGRESLLRLSRLADLADNTVIRNLAVTEALKRPSALPLAASDLAFLFADLADKERDADLLQVSLGLLESQPENPKLLNNVVWLELLQGHINEDRINKLDQFVNRFPSITELRTTLALARLITGDKTEALDLLGPMISHLDSPDHGTPAADLAVAAYALASNGEEQRALEVTTHLPWQSMMRVEREFFQEALK